MGLTAELKNKIIEVAGRLKIKPEWLEAVIANETAGTFDPSIKNFAGSGATGLIQFMPKTAIGLGTTTAALARMTAVQQMEYVYKYYLPYAKKVKSFPDLYLATFYPAAMGKPKTWSFPKYITPQNRALDLNKDGIITKGEFDTWILSKAKKRGYTFTNVGLILAITLVLFFLAK